MPLLTLTGHNSVVYSVAFSPDSKTVASGGGDLEKPGEVILWDVRTGEVLRTLTGHSSWINSVAFSPDGKMVASGSQDKTARPWDVSGLKK